MNLNPANHLNSGTLKSILKKPEPQRNRKIRTKIETCAKVSIQCWSEAKAPTHQQSAEIESTGPICKNRSVEQVKPSVKHSPGSILDSPSKYDGCQSSSTDFIVKSDESNNQTQTGRRPTKMKGQLPFPYAADLASTEGHLKSIAVVHCF